MSRPITALAAASPQRKVNIFGRRTSGPCGGRKRALQWTEWLHKNLCIASAWNRNQPSIHQMLNHGTTFLFSSFSVPVQYSSPELYLTHWLVRTVQSLKMHLNVCVRLWSQSYGSAVTIQRWIAISFPCNGLPFVSFAFRDATQESLGFIMHGSLKMLKEQFMSNFFIFHHHCLTSRQSGQYLVICY